MKVWAIADLHLSFGVENKKMDCFGEGWVQHDQKVAKNWKSKISSDDLVLIPGDISWALKLKDAVPDLEWVDALPGTKVLLRGNHDYWWSSKKKMRSIMPPSIHFVHNDVLDWKSISIGGARLWDSDAYHFHDCIEWKDSGGSNLTEVDRDEEVRKKIFQRELGRLELSLKELNRKADVRIAMTHYPPLGADLQDSVASQLLEKYGVHLCVFGHLHSVRKDLRLFGEKNGIHYHLTSCDYLDFDPILLLEL